MGLGALLRRAAATTSPAQQTRVLQSWDLGQLLPAGTKGMPTAWWSSRYRGGMSIPGAWRASLLLSDLLGRLPWHLFQDGPGEAAARLPTPLLLSDPAPPDSRMVVFSAWALDVLWHGNGVGLIAGRDLDGIPTAVIPVPADYVQVERIDEPLPGVPAGTPLYLIGGGMYQPHQVVHIKGPCEPGALRGMGVLEAHLSGSGGLDLAVELERYASGIATSAVPSATIKVANADLTEAEAEQLKARFMDLQRTRSPMVLNPSTDVTPLAWDPTEMQLLEARKFTLHQIALMFGLDPSWLGASQTSRVYSNLEMEGINLTRYSAGGLIARFEGELTRHQRPRQWVRASLDAELRPDTETRYRTYGVGIDKGFLTVDEVRALENRPPLQAGAAPAGSGPQDGPAQVRDESDLWLYWVAGEGLARWSGADKPLTVLYRLLARHMPPPRAAAAAVGWFRDALGREPTWRDGEVPDAPGAPGQSPALKRWIKAQGRALGDGDAEQLHQYWTKGEGLAKWMHSPHPWTALYLQLKRYIGDDEKAKATATAWYHDVLGHWPAEKKG